MAQEILNLLDSIFTLWVSADKMKYINRKMNLEARYNAEINKPNAPDAESYHKNPDQYRDNSVVDNLEFELLNLSIAIRASVGQSDSGSQPATGKAPV